MPRPQNASAHLPSAVAAWCRLIRLPNLFTAPGDALGGLFFCCMLTGAPSPSPLRLIALSAVSMGIYAFGILTNDLFDLREDSRERPERPLPAGLVSVRSAITAAIAIAVATVSAMSAMNLRSQAVTALLLTAVIGYNGFFKKWRLPGSIAMGLCRALNVALGIAVAEPLSPSPWASVIPAVGVWVIIAVVTWYADGENRTQRPGKGLFLPVVAVIVCWTGALPFIPCWDVTAWSFPAASMIAFLVALQQFGSVALSLYAKPCGPAVMQPAIGKFIRGLIPWQLSWILLGGTTTACITAFCALLCWSLSRHLSRLFPQS